MGAQPIADIQTSLATNSELTQRVIQLEAELAELQAIVNKFLNPYIDLNQKNGINGKGAFVQDLSVSEQAELDELVPIRILTDSDVRDRLDEWEIQYGMTSEEFYELWKRGEADHIPQKTGWSLLYEDWSQIQTNDNHCEA